MNNKPDDKLTERLTGIDDDLIAAAYDIDNAEKLKKYSARGNSVKTARKPVILRRVLIAAVCVCLCVGIAVSVPLMLRDDRDPYHDTENPESNGDNGAIHPVLPTNKLKIDSLDKLNYYGGLMSVMRSGEVNVASAPKKASPELLSAISEKQRPTPQTSFVPDNESVETALPAVEYEEYYRYPLDDFGVFRVTSATYFKIILDESCPFLCEKLGGAGEVEVVITQNNIDDMITFHKNGKYYSCLDNSGGVVQESKKGKKYTSFWQEFSTHKYIEGDCVIKNFAQENYGFYIVGDGEFGRDVIYDEITGFSYKVFGNGEKIPLEVVAGSTESSFKEYSFSISEIADYFNVLIQGEPNGELCYAFRGVNSDREPELFIRIFTSGEFYFCDMLFLDDPDNPDAYYLKGDNAKVEDGHITLHYTDENGEDVVVDLTRGSDGRFSYLGLIFEPQSIIDETTEELTRVYFAAYGEDGSMVTCLRADPDGSFTAGEPMYIDPYYSGYFHGVDLIKGYWNKSKTGKYSFTYFDHNKKVTIEDIDAQNGETFCIFDVEYSMCDDPFPTDEVTDIRLTTDGFRLNITRGQDYSVLDPDGKTLRSGHLQFSIDRRSVSFFEENEEGGMTGILGLISADGSIKYMEKLFFPEGHLIFDTASSDHPDDLILRFDDLSGDILYSLYIMRDGTYCVYNAIGGYVEFGKDTATFTDNGIKLNDLSAYYGKDELFAEFVGDDITDGIVLEGVTYTFIYDLR